MKPSDVTELHYITHHDNLASILQHGVLSHNAVDKLGLRRRRIDDTEVQARREKVLANGKLLHDYANLYFNCRNGMMFRLVRADFKDTPFDLCVIVVDRSVMNVAGVLATDMNAACDARIQMVFDILPVIDKSQVFARYWNDRDERLKQLKKARCMAELLVPDSVSPEFIRRVIVCTFDAKRKLLAKLQGLQLPVKIDPDLFFESSPGPRV